MGRRLKVCALYKENPSPFEGWDFLFIQNDPCLRSFLLVALYRVMNTYILSYYEEGSYWI